MVLARLTTAAGARNGRLVAVGGALFFCLFPFSGRAQNIDSTTFYGPSTDPTVIVDGSGFGSPPVAQPIDSGPAGDDFANGQLSFNNDTQGWQAGSPTNSLGLILSSYTSNEVIFGFGSGLTGNNPGFSLNATDSYRVSVNGATSSGTVNFSLSAVITSTTFEGPSTDPTVIVTGFNFGSAPVAEPVSQGTGDDFDGGQFFFVDDKANWQAGSPGNSLGLILLSYSPTEVTFGFGSALTGANPAYSLTDEDQFQVAVNGATFDGVVPSASPEPSTWLLMAVGSLLLMFLRPVSTHLVTKPNSFSHCPPNRAKP
jgi:hypothetical protein